ncbi:MAG: hypothetical protein K9H14_04000 [Actinomycetia bacterium]|nr:hypothetical protein [Actinomycetes bacterium]
MGLKLAQKENVYSRRSYPLLYLVDKSQKGKQKIVYSNSSLFYLIVAAVIMVCMGALFNVGLKIQNINYQEEILNLNQMISVEEERQDRLLLRVSELKSPKRILDVASQSLGMEISENMEVIEVAQADIETNEQMQQYLAKGPSDAAEQYNNFMGTIYYVQDIVMVVSESVLTFFIP